MTLHRQPLSDIDLSSSTKKDTKQNMRIRTVLKIISKGDTGLVKTEFVTLHYIGQFVIRRLSITVQCQ